MKDYAKGVVVTFVLIAIGAGGYVLGRRHQTKEDVDTIDMVLEGIKLGADFKKKKGEEKAEEA